MSAFGRLKSCLYIPFYLTLYIFYSFPDVFVDHLMLSDAEL